MPVVGAIVLGNLLFRKNLVQPKEVFRVGRHEQKARHKVGHAGLCVNILYLRPQAFLVRERIALHLGKAQFRGKIGEVRGERSGIVIHFIVPGDQQDAAHPHLAGHHTQEGLRLGKVAL